MSAQVNPNPSTIDFGRRNYSTVRRGWVALRMRLGGDVIGLIETTVALVLLLLLAPLLLMLSTVCYVNTGKVLAVTTRPGLNGRRIRQWRFNGDFPGRGLPLLFNVLRGDMAFVGPGAQSSADEERLSVRPGLVSLYALRRRVRIAHDSRQDIDREHIYRQSLKSNLGVVTRFLFSSLLGGSTARPAPAEIDFFGIRVQNKTMQQAVGDIIAFARSETQTQVAFVNPDCLNIAWRNRDYLDVLKKSRYVLPDGIGVHLGCRLQQVSLKANVNGTDLFPQLCEQLQHSGLRLFLLGARPGIAEATADNMRKRYPGLVICGTQHGYFDDDELDAVIASINAARAHIVLVAMGAPAQELWIDAQGPRLDAAVLMGVGGLFDFYSGRVSRAPLWVRELGMEWVWRILQEPGRMWKRYVVGNPLFLYRVWRHGKRQGLYAASGKAENKLPSAARGYLGRSLQRLRWSHAARFAAILKRSLDIGVASMSLLLLSPLLLLVAVAIRVESPGPVLFSQQRVGLAGRQFKFWKFRSMYVDAEVRKKELMERNEMQGGVLFKMKADPRITRIGRLIRRTSIDELPQLWNVLRGDMSLVGPRPCLPSEVAHYSIGDRNRLDAMPGLTCGWQVSGRSDIPFEQQVRMDLEYIHKAGVSEDLRLLLKTIPAIVSGRGAY